MITAVRLVDGVREMTCYPRAGIANQSLDVGFPEIREVVDARTDDDGDRDTTMLFGPRAVAWEAILYRDPLLIADLIDEIKDFLHPRSRPYIYVTDDEWAGERRMRLRVAQFAEPYEGYAAGARRKIQTQWKAPDGVWEAADLITVMVNADVASTEGLPWPISFPIVWPTTQSSGAQIVGNPGGTPSHFVARLYGPCSGPRLSNDFSGETIAFVDGLSISPGDYVEIDTRERTAYYLSNRDASRLQYLNFEVTSWWRMEPGDNLIRYHPVGDVEAGAAAEIDYRPAWL